MRGRFATTAILGRPPRLRVPDDGVGYLLRGATLYVDSYYASSSQTVPNLGTGGSTLDLTLGSTGTADSNDPQWLEYVATDGAYVYTPGVAGNYLSTPDAAALDVVGDIDLRVKVAMDDWTPASAMRLLSKYTSAGQRSFYLTLNAAGTLSFVWTADGTTAVTSTSSTATGVTDGAVKWVRAALDVDDGGVYKVYFYLSDDGTTWTQLGTTVTGGATTSIFVSTQMVEVGTSNSGATSPAAGKFYRAILKNGIDGTSVLDIDTSVITAASGTTFTATTGQTVTINRATAGRKTAVVHGSTRGGSMWAFGTDDYMTTNGDQDGLDMAAGDSFTVAWVGREWDTPTNNGALIAKGDSGSGGSYRIRQSASLYGALGYIADGTNNASDASVVSGSSGAFVTYIMVVDRTAQLVTTYQNGVISGSPGDTTAVGSLANAYALMIGRMASGTVGYQDFTFQAAVVDKGRAWSATEVAAVDAYFQGRTP